MAQLNNMLALFAVMTTMNGHAVQMEPVQDTWICEEYQVYAEEIGEQYNICPELIMAIIERESSGQADAVNGSCKGLMQVSERWHCDRMEKLGVTDLYDPYSNILVGTDYLVDLIERYEELPMVLMTYNGSSDAAERMESGNFTEYATGIIERAEDLEKLRLYNGGIE